MNSIAMGKVNTEQLGQFCVLFTNSIKCAIIPHTVRQSKAQAEEDPHTSSLR